MCNYSQGQREMLIDLRNLLVKKEIDYKVFDFKIDDKDKFDIGEIAMSTDIVSKLPISVRVQTSYRNLNSFCY